MRDNANREIDIISRTKYLELLTPLKTFRVGVFLVPLKYLKTIDNGSKWGHVINRLELGAIHVRFLWFAFGFKDRGRFTPSKKQRKDETA